MKLRNLSLAICLLGVTAMSAQAAPFLVCADYPAEASQPAEFLLYFDGATTPAVTPAVKNPETGLLRFRFDLASLKPGPHKVIAKARNMWGESALSSPFDFPAGGPAAPGGMGISPN
ncbi:MAG: hypothetical protein ABTR07_02280 [Candidatus Competibacter denitrificans]